MHNDVYFLDIAQLAIEIAILGLFATFSFCLTFKHYAGIQFLTRLAYLFSIRDSRIKKTVQLFLRLFVISHSNFTVDVTYILFYFYKFERCQE